MENVSRKDWTWQGQGAYNIPMESKPPLSNGIFTDRFFSESDRGTESNFPPTKNPGDYTPEEMAIAMKCLEFDCTPIEWDHFPGTPANHLVYFVGGDTGPIKIGWTQNLRNRLPCIQNGSSVPLSVLATQRAPKAKERFWHKKFASSRVLNEWFERTPELLAVIDNLNKRQEAL